MGDKYIGGAAPKPLLKGHSPLRILLIYVVCLCVFSAVGAFAAAFVPEQPIIPAENLRAGMKGYALTVLKGTESVKLPLEIVSVIPQKTSAKRSIMIRMLPSEQNKVGGVAQGMSGSPVYVGGRLAGAVSMGWNFSDHRIAMVTPIEDMCEIFQPEQNPKQAAALGKSPVAIDRLTVNGLSGRAAAGLQDALGLPLEAAPYGTSGELPLDGSNFSPGDAAAVFLAWGDVEMSAAGTVTATSKDGRFLAFGHPFMGRGEVSFPVARAIIHETVFSQAFPFKIASPVSMTGTITQDRPNGVGGRAGYFTPSIAASFVFNDMDAGRRLVKNFRVVPDAFLSARLLSAIYSGLVDDQWGRKGEGTASVNLRVDGKGLLKGWTRSNIFFSGLDVSSTAVIETAGIIDMIMLQPFKEVSPIGFRLEVSATKEPKVLYIEDVVVSSDAAPGDELDVSVTLRPWRREPVTRQFKLKVPKDATGSCELVVRGGGTNSLSQLGVDGGWKAVDGLERLLTEINAADCNSDLILELLHDRTIQVDKKAEGKKTAAELIPEEKEFLSETKARRMEEGTLRVARSEYFVDGMMRRLINLKESGGSDEK